MFPGTVAVVVSSSLALATAAGAVRNVVANQIGIEGPWVVFTAILLIVVATSIAAYRIIRRKSGHPGVPRHGETPAGKVTTSRGERITLIGVLLTGAGLIVTIAATWIQYREPPVNTPPGTESTSTESTTTTSPPCRNSGMVPIELKLMQTEDATLEESRTTKRVTFPGLTWAGFYGQLPNDLCNYQIDADVMFVTQARYYEGAGSGFGIGVCDKVSDGVPAGFILQYTIIQGAGSQTENNSGHFAMPDVNNGVAIPLEPDNKVHHWTVVVKDDLAYYMIDYGKRIGPFGLTREAATTTQTPYSDALPQNCDDSGVYLRLLNSTVDLSNVEARAVSP